jgi:hypothetical protein
MAITLHGTRTSNTDVLIPESTLDRKNATPLIINGDMAIAQRATSTSSASTDSYFACDRWRTNISSYGAYTISQSTDVPTGYGFANSFKIDCTTADASPAAGDLFTFEQRCEGQNFQVFNKGTSDAETFTLAFWIKSNLTGNFTVNLVDSDNSRRIGALVTISSANTWEKKVLNFAADTTGALGNDANDSFRVQFFLGVGTDFTSGTLPSAWEAATSANFAAGQTAFIGSNTSNELFITGLQLEVGTFDANTIQPFQHEDVGTNLARCQRYFHDFTAVLWGKMISSFGSYTYRRCDYSYPVKMRAIPTVSDILSTGITFSAQGQKETNCGFGTNSSNASTNAYVGGAKFDAEL